MENNKKQIIVKCEQNTCPICGGVNLGYGCAEDNDYGRTFPWTCEDCGATGKESYTETFDGNHYDVQTANGEPVEIVAPEAAPDPEDICPVCGGKLEYTGNCGEMKYGIRNEWRCTQCHATGWAEFSEETTYEFTGDHDTVRLADGSEWGGEVIAAASCAHTAPTEEFIDAPVSSKQDLPRKSAVKELLVRHPMCFECMSETCAFNPEGVCMYPVVYGKAPDLENANGCSGWIAKRDE